MPAAITLRPACSDDKPFLLRVYASTREEELALLPWDDEAKSQFCQMQFDAQHRYYHEQFPDAQFDLVVVGDQPVGRFYVHRRDDELRIIDIAILPERRSAGIGQFLVGQLLTEAARTDRPVRIHVERNNRALRFYERLGFFRVGDNGVHLLMAWSPGVATH